MQRYSSVLAFVKREKLADVVESAAILVKDSSGNGEWLQRVEFEVLQIFLDHNQTIEITMYLLTLCYLCLGGTHFLDMSFGLHDGGEKLVYSTFIVVNELRVEFELVFEILVAVQDLTVV